MNDQSNASFTGLTHSLVEEEFIEQTAHAQRLSRRSSALVGESEQLIAASLEMRAHTSRLRELLQSVKHRLERTNDIHGV